MARRNPPRTGGQAIPARRRAHQPPGCEPLVEEPHSNGTGTLTAIDGVDLTVSQGEALGLTGDNGAGKSTLLKLMAGVVAPTSGRVLTRGRIASVIELGVGFHHDLTGLENLEFSAALLGMPPPRCAPPRHDHRVLRYRPRNGHPGEALLVRHGGPPWLRPGDPRRRYILLLDEVLAVGDIGFQRLSPRAAGAVALHLASPPSSCRTISPRSHTCAPEYTASHTVVSRPDADAETAVRDDAGPMALTRAGLGVAPVRISSLQILPERVAPNQPFEIEAHIDVERPMPKGRLQLVLRPRLRCSHSGQPGSARRHRKSRPRRRRGSRRRRARIRVMGALGHRRRIPDVLRRLHLHA